MAQLSIVVKQLAYSIHTRWCVQVLGSKHISSRSLARKAPTSFANDLRVPQVATPTRAPAVTDDDRYSRTDSGSEPESDLDNVGELLLLLDSGAARPQWEVKQTGQQRIEPPLRRRVRPPLAQPADVRAPCSA
jgi:hypothetical protein